MPEEITAFPEVNRLVHEPARLAILTVLSNCKSSDFLFLQSATGLTKGNLSVQISRLEEAGLVTVDKTIRQKKTLTTILLTASGRTAVAAYWRTMDTIRKQAFREIDKSAKTHRDKAYSPIPSTMKSSHGYSS